MTSSRAPASVTIELIRGPLPAALVAAAEAIADNPYVTLRETRAFSPALIETLCHIVVRSDGSLRSILSMHPDGSRLVAVNRCVPLPNETLADSAARLFAEYPLARCVDFPDVYDEPAGSRRLRSRARRIPRGRENFVLTLPDSASAYHAMLGGKSRWKFRRTERELIEAHPSAEWRLTRDAEITPDLVYGIVALNHLRMEARGGRSAIDSRHAASLLALARERGAVCACVDGARILAGTICTRDARGWSLMVVAHDPAFDGLSLGTLCLFHTIEAAIADGARVFNFLWGRYAYKERLGGRMVTLGDRRFYRSALAWLFDWPVMMPAYRHALHRAYRRIRARLNLGRLLPGR